MVGLWFDKIIWMLKMILCSSFYKSLKVLGFLVFWGEVGLHTVASRDFHAKIRALSFWLHKLKGGCYFLVVKESPVKL